MSRQDSRIDDYIAKSPDFAKPILSHVRGLMHRACPEVEETLKWRHPTFMYKGIMCGMASFKQYCVFMYWKSALLFENDKPAKKQAAEIVERLGRLTTVGDLPADKLLVSYIKEAMRLNDEGIKPLKRKPKPKTELIVPDYLAAAMKSNPRAMATFEKFSYSHRKEYVEWLTEAKRPETQQQRLETAIAWMAEGKPRNWKYMNC